MLRKLLEKENRHKLTIVVGAAAMLLILLSSCSDSCAQETPEVNDTARFSSSQYREELEIKIAEIVSRIDGAGSAVAMVTLQGGEKTVYALEESISSDETAGESEVSGSNEQESRVIVIEGDGGEVPLVVTTLLPDIQGVLVLCEGADDPEVCERVTQAVTTVLGISSRRVCISILEKTEQEEK